MVGLAGSQSWMLTSGVRHPLGMGFEDLSQIGFDPFTHFLQIGEGGVRKERIEIGGPVILPPDFDGVNVGDSIRDLSNFTLIG